MVEYHFAAFSHKCPTAALPPIALIELSVIMLYIYFEHKMANSMSILAKAPPRRRIRWGFATIFIVMEAAPISHARGLG